MNLLTMLFLGFCAVIVIFQLVPATILFVGMIKGLRPEKTAVKAAKH